MPGPAADPNPLAGTPYDSTTGLRRPSDTAAGLTVVRLRPHGPPQQYSHHFPADGWDGVEHHVALLRSNAFIRPPSTRGAIKLLVLDKNGRPVDSYTLVDQWAMRYVIARLRLSKVPDWV